MIHWLLDRVYKWPCYFLTCRLAFNLDGYVFCLRCGAFWDLRERKRHTETL